MTRTPAPRRPPGHPLEQEPDRLERIVDVMWAEVNKVLNRRASPRRRSGGTDVARRIGGPVAEELLAGSSSASDILAEALAALLRTPEDAVTTSWEALAGGIAQNKAKGALRAAGAGLRETEHRPRLRVVPGDRRGPPDADGEPTASPFEVLVDPRADPEREFMETAQQLELVKLARDLLSERDRKIFFGLHFEGRTRVSLAQELGLTPPGVTHVYRTVARRLYQDPRFQRYTERGTL